MNGIRELMDMVEILARIPQKKEYDRGQKTGEVFGRLLERKTRCFGKQDRQEAYAFGFKLLRRVNE